MPASTRFHRFRSPFAVAVPPKRAFEVFTANMHRWWPPAHSILKAPRASITVEPQVGGRWYERATDESECTWGRVVSWDPPSRVVLTWQLTADFVYDPRSRPRSRSGSRPMDRTPRGSIFEHRTWSGTARRPT